MGLAINFNPAAVLTQHSLSANTRLLALISERLSSGVRLKHAGDGPSDMVIANSLRHERIAVDQGVSNSESAVSLMQTAEGGLDGISGLLIRMRTLAVGAANEGAVDPTQLAAMQAEFNAATGSIDAIATTTTFNGRPLLDGTFSDDELADDALAEYASVVHDARVLTGGIQDGSAITFGPPDGPLAHDRIAATFSCSPPTLPIPATTPISALVQGGAALDSGNGQVTVTGPNGSVTIAITPTTTIADFAAQVNSTVTSTGARASYDASTGQLVVESVNFGASGLTISSTDLTTTGGNVGLLDSDTTSVANSYAQPGAVRQMQMTFVDRAGVSHTLDMVQDGTVAGGLSFHSVGGGPETSGPYTGWDDHAFTITLRDTSDGAIGSVVAAPTVARTATRLTTAVIQAGPRESDAIRLEITDVRIAALGHTAGLAASGFADLASLGTALTTGHAAEVLRVVDAAIAEVSAARGAVGALQSNRVEPTMDSMRIGSVSLTDADSSLRDVDYASESAEFTRMQIMYQAATAMLAQANQIPQTVLQLLQQH